MRLFSCALGIAIGICVVGVSSAGELMYGCLTRPACGKVCKLVCETKKLTAVGYGCQCETICIPGPSKPGCKHCDVNCCCDSDIKGCPPKIEFCWYDWFACGCAKPRNIKVLTKYQAEKEICWYHWEVVDACDCGEAIPETTSADAALSYPRVYKPAPPAAEVGETLPVMPEERATLTAYLPAETPQRLIRFAGDDEAADWSPNTAATFQQESHPTETVTEETAAAAPQAESATEQSPLTLKQRFGKLLRK